MRQLVLCALLSPMLLVIQGCATSTGVMPMGPDTYVVTGESQFGPGGAQKKALEDANAFAATKDKHMIPINVETRIDWYPSASHVYELTFRLVDSDDPEYRRTNLEQLPDLIVKHENELDADIAIDDASGSDDIYTQLMKLKALKDDGILTEEEFQQEKKKVLETKQKEQ